MNLDFHYYGTYAAARAAGFTSAEAVEIARSAQYVDDYDAEAISERFSGDTVKTAEGTGASVKSALKSFFSRLFTDKYKDAVKQIWMPFHFLPGLDHAYYRGRGVNEKLTDAELDLLTRPNGRLVPVIVNWCCSNKSDARNLQRIGIAMHIIADTWAHQDFAGLYHDELNNAAGKVTRFDGTEINMSAIRGDYSPGYGRKLTPQEACLGHGRMGHLPDYPSYKYRYYPSFKSKKMDVTSDRDNPVQFLEAFKYLVKYMYIIKTGNNIEITALPSTADVSAVLNTDSTDQSNAWLNHIRTKYAVTMPAFDKNSFLTDAVRSVANSELSKFTDTVIDYKHMMTDVLKHNGIII